MAKGLNRPVDEQPGGVMQRIQRLQQQLAEAQERLTKETATATVGNGAIKMVMTGDQKCQSVEIDPALLESVDAETLQDLILAVTNLALDQSRELQQQVLGPLSGGDF